ncbi:MAG: Nramp family divalent metal transporter [Thiotrichales bacterium]|nr:MAG: Nramp family divalent metal transporter [Thiotrichales bacterium]
MNRIKPDSLKSIGPGIVIAATGVGAGDLIAASVSGAKFGTTILWAAVIGALFKYAINENLARWQLVTGTTLLEGWIQKLPRFVSIYFLFYLLLWSFIVAGALISATGLAAHAIAPAVSVETWGILHSIVAAAIVWFGAYRHIERIMKLLIAIMFIVVIACAAMLLPTATELLTGILKPSLPDGSIVFVLGVIGGVGGSVTVMSYGYWIREKKWRGTEYIQQCRVDLSVAYLLTGLFGLAVMIIAAGVKPEVVQGSKMILAVADHLETSVGATGKWLFLIGFWGAVFSSMIGVWDGVPYLFTDYVHASRNKTDNVSGQAYSKTPFYRAYLLYLALPPMVLLTFGKPVWIVVIYSVAGAFFMPFLAVLLIYMNNRRSWVGKFRNGYITNALLFLSILLFSYLLLEKTLRLN